LPFSGFVHLAVPYFPILFLPLFLLLYNPLRPS
jgi:hypothetical protein